jgi:5'-nucleotidase
MNILLTNDDGYKAEGINELYHFLKNSHDVMVIAPSTDKSGSSSSLTIRKQIEATKISDNLIAVDGTPADCIYLGLNYFLADSTPDLVISGINHGANLGDDIIYSGTFGGALEGRNLCYPSIAISLDGRGEKYFETASLFIEKLINASHLLKSFSHTIFNINVPDVAFSDLNGIKVVPHGRRHPSTELFLDSSIKNSFQFTLGKAGSPISSEFEDDFQCLANNYITMTPVSYNYNDKSSLQSLSKLMENI